MSLPAPWTVACAEWRRRIDRIRRIVPRLRRAAAGAVLLLAGMLTPAVAFDLDRFERELTVKMAALEREHEGAERERAHSMIRLDAEMAALEHRLEADWQVLGARFGARPRARTTDRSMTLAVLSAADAFAHDLAPIENVEAVLDGHLPDGAQGSGAAAAGGLDGAARPLVSDRRAAYWHGGDR